jgi:VCBS repeat-containing protein
VIGTPTVAAVTEDSASTNLTATGSIAISDADQGQASFSTASNAVTNVGTPLGSLVLASNGNYTYTVANSATQYLGAGQTVTDQFTITALDGTTKVVGFTITGTDDLPIVETSSVTALPTTKFEYQFSAQDFKFIDPDSTLQEIRITELPKASTVDKPGKLVIRNVGSDNQVVETVVVLNQKILSSDIPKLFYIPDGDTEEPYFRFSVITNGVETSSDAKMSVDLLGQNLRPYASNIDVESIDENAGLVFDLLDKRYVGDRNSEPGKELFNSDGKPYGYTLKASNLEFTVDSVRSGVVPSGFRFDEQTNQISIDQSAYDYLAAGESTTVTIRYTITDDSGQARNNSIVNTFTVTITGTNDAPLINQAPLPQVAGDITDGLPTSVYTAIDSYHTDSEMPYHAFDNDTSTKYYGLSTSGALFIDAGSAKVVSTLGLTTANDDWDRDPSRLVISGSNDGTSYSAIHTTDLTPPSARFTNYADVTFTNTTAYRYYKLEFPLAENGNGNIQLSEIRLIGSSGLINNVVVGEVTEVADGATGENINTFSASGSIAISDVDLLDEQLVTYVPAEANYLGTFTTSVSNNTTSDGAGQIVWNFSAPDASVDYFSNGQTKVQTYAVVVNDGKGGTVTQDVTVTITGTNDAPVINAIAITALTEQTDSDALTTTIPITFTDVDLTDIGYSARITGVVATGDTTGLALTNPQLLDLVNPGTVTKASGSSDGSLDMNFIAPATALDYLAQNEVLTLKYTIEVNHGDDSVTPKIFAVNITGTNDIPMLEGVGQDISGDEDTTVELNIQNFSELIDHDLTDQIYIEILEVEKLDGKLEQVILGGQFKSITKEDPTVKLKRDITGKTELDGDLRFIPNPNVSGNVQVRYRLWDGRGAYSSTIGIIPIVLAAQVDGILADSMRMSLSSSLEISETAILKVNAINSDPSELLIFKLELTQGALTESFNYSINNNEDGIFEIEMEKFAKSIGINNAFNYNEFINVSLSAKSIDEDDESDWSEPITAQVLAIPDMSKFIDLDPSSPNKDYRKLIFGANDFADAAENDDFNFIAPDYEFVTSTNANFNDVQLSASLKNIFGTIGNDTIYAPEPTSGDDIGSILFGSQGQDYLYGNSGNDMLIASEGFDTMRGGQGADLFVISKDILYDQYAKTQMDDLLNTIIGPANGLSDTLFSLFYPNNPSESNEISIAGYVRDFTILDRINFSDFNKDSLSHVKLDEKHSFVYSTETSTPVGVLVNFSFSQNGTFNETDFIAHQIL